MTIDDMAAAKVQSPRALPASWYWSKALFDLERRAVFSRQWILITHRSRLQRPGDYLRYETAGFPFFLLLDRQNGVRGFHNVCRHRAFPIVTQDQGNASILACKYHGWSYGLPGNLAKAPRFDTVPEFDKKANGLFPIHVHVDERGFVWVNLEASSVPSISWSDQFQGADTQPRLADFSMDEYAFDHAWQMDGDYNWKTLVDNYNECYHCGVAHPGIAAISDLTTYNVETVKGQIQHFVKDKPTVAEPMPVAPTFFFPNASVTMTPPYFYMMRVVPKSSTTTSMQYEVYRNKLASEEDFDGMDRFFKQVESEDKDLCNAAQKNLNAGTYVTGQLHPFNEKGVLHFQSTLRQSVEDHHRAEEEAGGQIWPTRQGTSGFGEDLMKDMALCEAIDCQTSSKKDLHW